MKLAEGRLNLAWLRIRCKPHADVLQVEVPSIGTPKDDPKTVDLKLRQVQKEKGTMKVRLLLERLAMSKRAVKGPWRPRIHACLPSHATNVHKVSWKNGALS